MKVNELRKEKVTDLVTNNHVENKTFDMEQGVLLKKYVFLTLIGQSQELGLKKNASKRYEVAKKIIFELTQKDTTNIKKNFDGTIGKNFAKK